MVAELLVPIAAVAAVVLVLHFVFRVDDGDDDDRGSDGGGTKRRPGGGPRTPPRGEQICWPEFERQFAEYVALSQGRGQRRERARRRADHPDRTMPRRANGGSIRANRPEGVPMAKPMFFYAGVYDSTADAEHDYDAIKQLHTAAAIGSYDAAIIVHEPGGEVKVTKTEKPTQHGAWIGLAAGAGAAVVFPFLLPAVSYAGMAGAGAGLGAWFGHLAHGTSRGEAKEIGAMLQPGTTALVVVGIDQDAEAIEQAADLARASTLKRDVGDWDEAEQDALASIERAEQHAAV